MSLTRNDLTSANDRPYSAFAQSPETLTASGPMPAEMEGLYKLLVHMASYFFGYHSAIHAEFVAQAK